jgi:ABC-type multidrug transport system ATPase subunit
MFRLDSVVKSYAGERALDGVSLSIKPCNATALIGSSGSGKSTLFGLLTGLMKPDGSTSQLQNRPADDFVRVFLRARRLTGVRP